MKLTITRTLGTAFAMTAIAAAGSTAPAYADPPLLNGTYTGADSDGEFVWAITSTCATEGCTATVASNKGWTSVATLRSGIWRFTVTKPDGAICDNGNYAPAAISLAIDPVSLNGTVSADSNHGCPGGEISQTPIKLRKLN